MTGKESVDYYYRKEQFDWLDVCAGMLGAIVGCFSFPIVKEVFDGYS